MFRAAVWRKHQEAPRHKTNRTMIIDLGNGAPSFSTRLWIMAEKHLREGENRGPSSETDLQEKNSGKSEDHRSGRMERQADLLQLSRAAAFG